MKAKVNITPKIQLVIDDKEEMAVLHKAIVLSNHPHKCSECGNKNLKIVSNKDTQGNTYINMLCLECGAKAKLGQYKTGGYFWHRDFKIWKKKKQTHQEPQSQSKPDDHVPF